MLKQKVKNLLGSYFSNSRYPIIVNSYGRSGSTVLTKSIIESAIDSSNKILYKIAYRSISQSSWELEKTKLRRGIVYKTHDYPPEDNFKNKPLMIYTFADPIDVVLSLLRLYDERGETWMRKHYAHLKTSFENFSNIIIEDQLHLENHLNCWLQEKRFPVAFVKYESIWNHQKEISDFIGFNIQLPTFRKRKAKKQRSKNKRIVKQLNKTYGSLSKKIEELDNFFVNNLEN